MTLYVLDTDHISLQQRSHPAVLQRLQALGDDDSVAVTVMKLRVDAKRHHNPDQEPGVQSERLHDHPGGPAGAA